MKQISLLIKTVIIAIAVIFCGCTKESQENYSLVNEGDQLPAFSAEIASGGSLNSSDVAGKTVFIYFFASYCPDCHVATPNVLAAWQLVKDYADFEFLCVARGGGSATLDAAKEYWKSLGTPENMPTLYYDRERAMYNKFATQEVPRYYIADNTGKITWADAGNYSAEQLKAKIDQAINR